jgi:hypothetical protein
MRAQEAKKDLDAFSEKVKKMIDETQSMREK